jgi:hypothetical protein
MVVNRTPLYELLYFHFVTRRRQVRPDGMMEGWNNGMVMKKAEKDQLLIVRNTSEPITPSFQYSSGGAKRS